MRTESLETPTLSFRRLAYSDLPLMLRWVNAPHVRRWYSAPRTAAGLAAKYGPRIEGRVPTDPYLILLGGRPVGYIQTYRIADYPDYARHLQLAETAAGVDLFLGERALLHRGLGTRVLRRFLCEIVFADPEVESCVLGPEPENVTAIRCYEKAGCRFLREVQIPGEPQPEYLMRVTRAELDQ